MGSRIRGILQLRLLDYHVLDLTKLSYNGNKVKEANNSL